MTLFQYYTSPIQTVSYPPMFSHVYLFQYYTSPIQTKSVAQERFSISHFNTTLVRFKLVLNCDIRDTTIYFNTTLVRFKPLFSRSSDCCRRNFNTTLVRFKHGRTGSPTRLGIKFQYYTSPIQTHNNNFNITIKRRISILH